MEVSKSQEDYIRWAQRFERVLQDLWLKRLAAEGPVFQDICTYFMEAGGKRLRPCLVYAVAEDVELDQETADVLACTVEWIHQNTLVLDDMPALDNDDLRHGKPSVHKAFGEAKTILEAYGSVYFLYGVLAELSVSPMHILKIMRAISHNCGLGGLVLGEWTDLETFGEKEISSDLLQEINHHKTGALFALCLTMPAVAKGLDENHLSLLEQVGYTIGRAFQVHDDLLNYMTTAQTLGKDPRSDQQNYKPTLVTLWGQDRAHQYLAEQYESAIKLLAQTGRPFRHLKEFILFMQQRRH